MPRQPNFAEPSSYIRYVGPVLGHAAQRSQNEGSEERLRFLRLNAREGPLKYPYTFAFNTPGQQTTQQTMSELELQPKHIAQIFAGVSYGGRLRFYHPFDERLLKWDETQLTTIQEKDTANIEYEDSPIDAPRFNFWLAPTENFVPAFDAEAVHNSQRPPRSLDVQLMILASKYTYEFVTREKEPDLYDKLSRFQIPSRFATFGGKI